MANEILPYFDIVQRERIQLQKGMNFRVGGDYSILLMSRRSNAPYVDGIDAEGNIIYEGHDVPAISGLDPKSLDQPMYTKSGRLTENGKFYEAAKAHSRDGHLPERVQIYEKLFNGVWSDNGRFALVDAWVEDDGNRKVFKFRLVPLNRAEEEVAVAPLDDELTRAIPSSVKAEVYKRDQGKCAICGAKTNLHFDHILPYSLGGSSTTAENVQILCARHNIAKGARIE